MAQGGDGALAASHSSDEGRSVLDLLPVLISRIDAGERYRFVNTAYREWFGLALEQVVGRTVAEVLGPAAYDVVRPFVLRALAGERVTFEQSIPYTSGTRDVQVTYTPVGGGRDGFVAMVVDVSERRRVDAALRVSEDRLRELNQVQQLISGELDLQKVVQAVTDVATAMSGADFGAFFYNVIGEEGERYTLYTLSGVPRESFEGFPMPRNTALFGPTFRGEGVVRIDDVHKDARYGTNPPYHGMPKGHLPVVSYLAVPVVSRSGEVLGGLFFGHEQPGIFTAATEDLVKGLAAQAAVSMDNARLFDEQKRSERRLAFLADASRVLGSSLDYEETLQGMVRLAVPAIADWAGADVIAADGTIKRLAVAATSPEREDLSWDLSRRYPVQAEGASAVPEAIRTGEPVVYSDVTDSLIDAWTRDDEHRALIKAMGLCSIMVVPLRARERILGALWFATLESGRRFGAADRELAVSLGDRAAVAVDNSRLYSESVAAYEQAQRASRMKDEFLATLSHELRTPLSAIVGWAHLLGQGELDEAARHRAIEAIRRNATVQTQLISDILDVSRIVAGRMRLEVRPVELTAVVEAALDTVRPAAEAKKIALATRLDPAVSSLSGDGDRLQQVVWNLLSNAVKFTPAGGTVEVRLRPADGHVLLSVQDSGPGIPPDALPHVFERFQQADASSTRRHGGLGLGLAIVRHLVELHGGTVEAANAPEGGAVFEVRLPTTLRAAPAVALEAAPANGGPPQQQAAPGLDGVKVLVVEDHPDARELVFRVLENAGARVTAVATAAEALAAIERERPDVLLSDIEMPGQDGYELMRILRTRPPQLGGDVPAAALTAYAGAENRRAALSAGYQAHLAKPVQPDTLIDIVRRLGRPPQTSAPDTKDAPG
jgi:PAS domain S-box-containing protein